jgi:predicted Rossmann fold nucleotide-binding protein DprA/Smf involved in DNA uptake
MKTSSEFLKRYNIKQVAAITGHRPHKLGKEYKGVGPYSDHIRSEFARLFTEHKIKIITSGFALGADQLAVEVAISLGLDVEAAIPCDGQERIWPRESRIKYNELLNHPLVVNRVVVCPGPYEKWKMYARNRYMVNSVSRIFSVWDGVGKGGTYDTVKYSREVGRPLFNIDPEGWRPKQGQLTLF